MKKIYTKPEIESSPTEWASDLLVDGSVQVMDFKQGPDIFVGDEDNANTFNNSLWDED